MQLTYKISIDNPEHHYAKVRIEGSRDAQDSKLSFFLPSWSPGSYLMREYGRNIRQFRAFNSKGEFLYYQQTDKGVFEVNWQKSDVKQKDDKKFSIEYEVYCHELTVRTSHIDTSHAFIHGPSTFMGILEKEIKDPILEVNFPALWSKISTGLKDISPSREKFVYTAKDYDDFIDTPLEMGCHETDGFMYDGVAHELAFYGDILPHKEDFKKDIKTIVETVAKTMGGVPYEKYTFISHFVPGIYGGLEHKNSTALHFDALKLSDRETYLKWLELVAHEYFHTWNVKRIRPKELGPFDYLTEAKTRMHWLTEGLTSFMDQLFVYRSGLMNLDEYLKAQVDNLNQYLDTPGRKFHSLEDSSFNAWIKLYRPDENSRNSSISYYLKGGIVFFMLNTLLVEKGKSIDDLLKLLWDRYNKNPDMGMEDHEVYQMVEELGGKDVRAQFETMIITTEEIDLEKYLAKIGLAIEYSKEEKPDIGIQVNFRGDRVQIASVILDSPAYKAGLNAEDEIIAINGLRILQDRFKESNKFLIPEKSYRFTVARLGRLVDIDVTIGKAPQRINKIIVKDEKLIKKAL